MRSNHARHASKAPTRFSRPRPDLHATTVSSAGRVAHCGLNSIHGYYQRRYTTSKDRDSLSGGNITITSGGIQQRASATGRKLPDQEFLTWRAVRYGNKLDILAAADPEADLSNFLPFYTGSNYQWRGRRRCGPRCGVSRTE
jgi:hypothetical protein